ncbi:MAG: hypothetical protein ACK47B_01775 [Armatimonadota bacterium]
MKKNEPTDVKKLTMLSAGIVVAVGAAYWSISSTLASEPAPRRPNEPASGAELAQATSAQPGTTAAPAVPAPAGEPAGSPLLASGEMLLAVEADPFAELPPAPDERAANASKPVAAAVQLTPPAGFRPPALPGIGSGLFRIPVAKPAGLFASVAPSKPVVEPAPELLGTLLGSHPSAIFASGGGMAVVPAGGRYGSWRVVAVDHGTVTVKSRAGTRELRVRGVLSAGAAATGAGSETALAEPEAPFGKTEDLMALAPTVPAGLPVRPVSLPLEPRPDPRQPQPLPVQSPEEAPGPAELPPAELPPADPGPAPEPGH